MNTGLLLEEPVLGVPVSVISSSSFPSGLESLSFPEVSRRIGHGLPPAGLVRLVDDGRVVSICCGTEALRGVQVDPGLGRYAVAAQSRASPIGRFLRDESRADARHLLRSCTTHIIEDAL